MFVRSGAVVVASTFVWHISNFGFNAAAAHLLQPAKYGNLTSAVALLGLANPVLTAVQTIASRLTTSYVGRGEEAALRGLLFYYGRRVLIVGALVALGLGLASSGLARFLREPSLWPVATAVAIAFVSLVTHLQRGVLQGAKLFGRYSISTVVEGVTKIVLAVAFLLFVSRSVEAALIAVGLASLLGAAANAVLLRWLPHGHAAPSPESHPYRYSLVTLTTLALLALLFAIDVLAAKRYLSPHDAGVYAAISLAGKVIFFASSAVSLFLFPLFSSRQDEGLDSRRLLAGAFAVVAVGSALVVAVYAAAPGLIVVPLFGHTYDEARAYIAYSGVAFGLYAIVYLGSLYLLSHGREQVTAVLAVVCLGQLYALYTFHTTFARIVGVQITVFAVGAAAVATLCFVRRRDEQPAT